MANPLSLGNQSGLGELWARLRFLLLAIIVYRVGTHIPVPGVNPDQLAALFSQNQGTILGLFNMFSGGALERMSILALGIMPYISAKMSIEIPLPMPRSVICSPSHIKNTAPVTNETTAIGMIAGLSAKNRP